MSREDSTLIFLVPHAPPSDFARKYFARELRANGFRVLYWDVGRLMGYDLKIGSNTNDDSMIYTLVRDKAHLRELLKHESDSKTVFVPQISPSLESRPIFNELARIGAKTAFYGRGYLPLISEPGKGRAQLLKTLFTSRDKLTAIRRLWRAVMFRLQPPKTSMDLIFTAGELAEEIHANDAKSIVRIHHFDVDMAIENRGSVEPGESDFNVFLDDYLPFHPDFGIDRGSRIDSDRYYSKLNEFFSRIERETGHPVVIAAHPKASYDDNPFEGRKIVFGRTHSLVAHSKLVMTHGSTAISYAVIFNKPVLLLSSDDIRTTHFHLYSLMERTSDLLECTLVNFDRPFDLTGLKTSFDTSKYSDYRKRYLSNSDDPRPSSEIVVSTLRSLTMESAWN